MPELARVLLPHDPAGQPRPMLSQAHVAVINAAAHARSRTRTCTQTHTTFTGGATNNQIQLRY